ncbi:hypothetical protein ACFPAF_15735 [Hymenobacter endophyticus]|uniref:Uncharacterized protein n=1 Tax=Hymenobacter endophyticus TaxID=3076335 RepID=A0ABU3TKF9_9BACT|nr:hypothetical protein [Hymenobacter endophyticus]MDU0371854.1 hypothetical protein [Hymenobacter endophyticus]
MLQRVAFLLLALLLSAATAWAQDEAKVPATPTNLPGEEKLSPQERAERDFLMPVRRKQAAKLRAAADEAGVHQPALEATIQNLETVPEAEKLIPVAAPETKAAPAAAPYRTSSTRRRSSSTHRSSSRTSSRKKATAKKSTAKRKPTRRR